MAADDERRVEAGILFELSYNLSNGHTFIPLPKLCAATAALLNLETELIEEGITRLTEQERLVVDAIAGLQACYLPEFYEAETYITARLLQMAEKELPAPKNLDALVSQIEAEQGYPMQVTARGHPQGGYAAASDRNRWPRHGQDDRHVQYFVAV